MPEPSNIRVRIVGATDVGLVREHNEDNYLILDLDTEESDFSHLREYDLGKRGALLVVCDGMGGAAAGEVASQMAVLSMRQQLLPPPSDPPPVDNVIDTAAAPAAGAADAGSPEKGDKAEKTDKSDKPEESELHKVARRLRDAAQRANQEIYEAACADIAKAGMGTTLTALMLLQSHVAVAQVGDSRAYLWRQGRLTQITHDQSLVNQLLDSGQITPEQAKLFEHSNVILQALGVQEDIEVVLSSETLRRDDRLLLCSDGLVGVVSDEEIQEVLGTTENLEEGVHRLIDMARAGGGPDNITVILAQAFGEGLPPPTAEDVAQYKAMALDGDKPPERRTWSTDYSYSGGTSAGGGAGPSSTSSGRFASPVSLLSMAAVLALAVTGLVVGLVLYPQHTTPAPVACSVTVDPPGQSGLQVMVDDRPAPGTAATGMELRLTPGDHRLWLSTVQDGARRSEDKILTVSATQRCEVALRAATGSIPAAAAPDAAGTDNGSGRMVGTPSGTTPPGAATDAGAGAKPAGSPGENGGDEPGTATGDTDQEPGGPGTPPGGTKIKRPRTHRHKPGEGPAGTGPAAVSSPSGSGEAPPPAANPDLASPAAAPAAAKPDAKSEVKPEPATPEKTTPAAPAADKAGGDKPASEKAAPAAGDKSVAKPATDKATPVAPAGDKPAAKPAADKPAPAAGDKPSPAPATP